MAESQQLGEQVVDRLLATAAEPEKGAVIRLDVASQPTERHLTLTGPGDALRRADADAPGFRQGGQHHRRVSYGAAPSSP